MKTKIDLRCKRCGFGKIVKRKKDFLEGVIFKCEKCFTAHILRGNGIEIWEESDE